MKRFLILFVTAAFFSCQKEQAPLDPWNAQQLASRIASSNDWDKDYNVSDITTETKFLDVYNQECMVKTLYPGTTDELTIIYQDSIPTELYWNQSGQWITDYATVGDPISVLEKANEKPISFYGLGYDLPGKVKIDSGKVADKKITYAVRPTSDIIPTEFYSYNSFELSDPESQELKLFITRVQIDIPKKKAAVKN